MTSKIRLAWDHGSLLARVVMAAVNPASTDPGIKFWLDKNCVPLPPQRTISSPAKEEGVETPISSLLRKLREACSLPIPRVLPEFHCCCYAHVGFHATLQRASVGFVAPAQ